MATESDIGKLFLRMEARYPSLASQLAKQSAEMFRVRKGEALETFADVSSGELQAAAAQVFATCTDPFGPTFGAIRLQVLRTRESAGGELDASGAWRLMAQHLVNRDGCGSASWGTFAPPELVRFAAERFGHDRFALRLTEDNGTDYAQFRGIYESEANRRREGRGNLPGTNDLIKRLAGVLTMPQLAAPAKPLPADRQVAPLVRPANIAAAIPPARGAADLAADLRRKAANPGYPENVRRAYAQALARMEAA